MAEDKDNKKTKQAKAPWPDSKGKKPRKYRHELTAEERLKRKKRRRITFWSIIGILVIFRMLLPWIVLRYVNNKLEHLDEYYGHVADIDIHLYRGAYVIKDLKLMKRVENRKSGTKDTIPFFKTSAIDLSIEWEAIWDGAIVGEIEVENPVLNFVKETHKGENVKADTADFRQLIDDLMPVTVNRFGIHDGEIHFIDPASSPRLDVKMHDINIVATNLTNAKDKHELLPATLTATAEAYHGNFYLTTKFDALAENPTFDLSARLMRLNLPELNPFLQAYANFDVKKGDFSVYTEFAAKNGSFGGYVKPLLENLDIVQFNKEEGDFGQIVYESLIAAGAWILKNKASGQLATRIPIEGNFSNPKINVLYAIGYLLRNGFLKGLKPSLDQSINIHNMRADKKKTLLEKVFGKNDDKKDDKDTRADKKETRKEKRKQKKKKG